MQENLSFVQALDLDLAAHGMKDAGLGKRVGVSQQSINKWRQRGFPPSYRLQELQDVFGPNSHLAKLNMEGIYANAARLRQTHPKGTLPAGGTEVAGDALTTLVGGAKFGTSTQLVSAFRESLFCGDARADAKWETPATAWRSVQEVDFFKALPPRLRVCVEPSREETGRLTPDMLTPGMALNLVFDTPGRPVMNSLAACTALTQAAMHLLALRARHKDTTPERLVVGWVRSADRAPARDYAETLVPEITGEWLPAIGVQVVQATTGAELAALLAAAE